MQLHMILFYRLKCRFCINNISGYSGGSYFSLLIFMSKKFNKYSLVVYNAWNVKMLHI